MTKLIDMPNESSTRYIDGMIYDVPINKVKVDPQDRIRLISGDYRLDPKYIALKKSMDQQGQFHAITIKPNLEIIAGFYRFCVGLDLSWKTIRALVKDVSDLEARLIEILENLNRINFTDYESYVALARLKREYEKTHPETKRGKYDRCSMKNHDCDSASITENFSVMIPFQRFESFSAEYSTILGMTSRSLRNKTRIGNAILDGKFKSRTIRLLKQGKVSQNKLLSILRNRDIRNQLASIQKEEQEKKQEKKVQGNKIHEIKKIKTKVAPVSEKSSTKTEHKGVKIKTESITSEIPLKDIREISDLDEKQEISSNDSSSEIFKKEDQDKKDSIEKKGEYCKNCPMLEKIRCPRCNASVFICKATEITNVRELNDEACFQFNK